MDSKTWWIIIAIIVVVVILVLIAAWQGKRRTAARRGEAQHLRGRAKNNEGTVVESRQRAETAEEQAERARAEAEEKQRRADQLEAEAEHERKTAEAVERDHQETLKKADRLDPDTPTDRHGNRVEGTGSRGDGGGESRIDPNTGRPVEEAARDRDVRAERPAAEAGAAGAGYDQQQRGIRPEGGQHQATHDHQHDEVRPAGDPAGDDRPVREKDAGDTRDEQHATRPDGSVGDERPAAHDDQSEVRPEDGAGSPGVFNRERTEQDLPAAEDGVADPHGLPVKDKVNRLFGRHARDNGPDDGVEPPKH